MDPFPIILGERPSHTLGPVPIIPAWLCYPATPSSVWALVLGWPCQPGMVPSVCSVGCHRKISGYPGWGAPWGIPCACSVPAYLPFLFLQHHRTCHPQPPSWGPSGSGILFDTLKTSSGPSYRSVCSQNCLTKGPTLGTSPSPPGPWLGRGLQKAEINSLTLDCNSRDRTGWGWADHPNPLWAQAPCPEEERLCEAYHSCLPDCLPAVLTVTTWHGQQ